MMSNKIIKKAWIVWHDGMLSSNPLEGFQSVEEVPVVYAETKGLAKTRASEPYDYKLNGEEPKFTDLKAKRAKGCDVILVDGQKITRRHYKLRKKEEARIEERRKKVEAFSDDARFYIQNGYVGNSVLFWALNSCGYTCDIKKAQDYSKEEVLKKFVTGREEDIIWEASHIKENIKSHVDGQYLSREYCC